MRHIYSFTILFIGIVCALFSTTVYGQADPDEPKIEVVESFQQSSIGINSPLMITIWIKNPSDYSLDSIRVVFSFPGFLKIHPIACDQPVLTAPIVIDDLAPHSTIAQPLSVCLELDRAKAIAGSYNLLTSVSYRWEAGDSVTSIEKELKVDLVGVDTIMGVPIGLAGFVLPGLLLLTTLRWFSVPKLDSFDATDRIILGILLSLVLLGPFAWLASQPGSPAWVRWLDFQQQISIERLVVFSLAGISIGALAGFAYRGYLLIQKKNKARYLAWLKINTTDKPPVLLKKALILNPELQEKQLYIQSCTGLERIYGYHFAFQDDSIFIFPRYQLVLSRLSAQKRSKILKQFGTRIPGALDQSQWIAVLDLLDDQDSGAFFIADYILVEKDGSFDPLVGINDHMTDKKLYGSPQPGAKAGRLLEIIEEEPI